MLRNKDKDPNWLLDDYKKEQISTDVDYLNINGTKEFRPISDAKRPFLKSVKKVIESLKSYWPLSVRQIHYQLLNDPPMKTVVKNSKHNQSHYRYKNDKESYNALISLLTPARYLGEVSMDCIDDATRPKFHRSGFTSLSGFISSEVRNFLTGLHIDKQKDQPRHIHVFAEKNTVMQILKPTCDEYYVPFTIGRGYASVPVWRDIAAKYFKSGKERMTFIVASDYDPEGLDLVDDAARSIRQFNVPEFDVHRIGVNRNQIDELRLCEDFNSAKNTSTRYKSFVERTGGNKTWELEALPPDYLKEQLRVAIEANMDMEIYNQTVDKEREDVHELQRIRRELVIELDI